MGKNKLHMVDKKTKKRKKRTKRLTKKDKQGIVDVPIAKEKSLGSKASKGLISYNYQGVINIPIFIKEIISRDTHLQKVTCIPTLGTNWINSALVVKLHKGSSSIPSLKLANSDHSKNKFVREIDKCMSSRLVAINLNIRVVGSGQHANLLIIDTKEKTVELFEPHGARAESSELESVSRAYQKVSKQVRRFFSFYYPELTFIPPSKFEPSDGLQMRIDAFSGLCVTWTILYLHYRILNPDIKPKRLVTYIEKKVTKPFMLRYTRYVEDVIKHKQ